MGHITYFKKLMWDYSYDVNINFTFADFLSFMETLESTEMYFKKSLHQKQFETGWRISKNLSFTTHYSNTLNNVLNFRKNKNKTFRKHIKPL